MRNLYNISHLSVASWNVQGLGSKVTDQTFLNEIRKHHILALVETHCTSDMHIAIEGYYTYQVNRSKTGNKAHGGIAFIVKNELRPGIKFYSAQSNDLLWIHLKKDFFRLQSDIFIGAVYISPLNSSYSKKLEYDPFEIIEQEIMKYSGQGQIILMGDFNARSSTFQDFVSDSGTQHIQIPSNVSFDSD